MPRSKRLLLAFTVASGLLSGALHDARAAYPDHPVVVTVPAAPGGTVDIVARILGDQLGRLLGQPLVINNKPGAGGIIGTQALMHEIPDGYNLLVTANSNQLIVPWVYRNAKFDPIKDFVPVAAVGIVPNVLLVNSAFPAKDLKQFMALVKANPGKYQYASAGSGTLNHLLGEMLKDRGGMDLRHIPYRGVAPAMSDVFGGQVDMVFASLPAALEAVKSGKLRALGVSSTVRVPLLPDVPAIAEQIPGFSGDLWVAVYAPRGTPKAVVDRLYGAITTALGKPELTQRFAQLGVTILHDGPPELASRQEREFVLWRDIVKHSGATAD